MKLLSNKELKKKGFSPEEINWFLEQIPWFENKLSIEKENNLRIEYLQKMSDNFNKQIKLLKEENQHSNVSTKIFKKSYNRYVKECEGRCKKAGVK